MLEVERNSPIEPVLLAEFLARCGWEDTEAAVKLGWVLEGSDDWVACRLDGELVAFGRSARSPHEREVVLSVLVDPRFGETGLGLAIANMLTDQTIGLLSAALSGARPAPPDTYLGKSGKHF